MEEEISYLDDKVKFHKENVPRLKNKIEKLKIKISQQEIEDKLLSQQLQDLEKEAAGTSWEENKDEEEGSIEKEYEKIPARIPSPEEIEEDAARIRSEYEETEKIRAQVKELFADRKEAKKPLNLKEALGAILKPIGKIAEKTKEFDAQKIIRPLAKAKKPFENISEKISKLERQKIIRYALPAIMLVFLVSVLFVSKPEITGYAVLTEKNTYEDNLNLIINESGNYTWAVDKSGNIESIKASGRVKGNGSVKVYIEKDGERHLIYGNK